MCNIVQIKGVKKNGLACDFVDLFGLLIFLSSFSARFLEFDGYCPIVDLCCFCFLYSSRYPLFYLEAVDRVLIATI